MARISGILAALTITVGCHSQNEFGEVEGVVQWGGIPLDRVQVTFAPETGIGTDRYCGSCFAGPYGGYRLRTG